MKEIVISVPDDFTDEQADFIKQSAMLQIEAEIKKELTIPQEQIDAVNAKIAEVKTAMRIKEEIKPIPIIGSNGTLIGGENARE